MGNLKTREAIARTCDLTVVTCIDHRLHGTGRLHDALTREFGSDVRYDFIALPGAIHRLVNEGTARREEFLGDLAFSIDLHDPETLVLVPHMECGVYHEQHAFSSLFEELSHLHGDFLAVCDLLRGRFPNLTVRGFVARIQGLQFHGLEELVAVNAFAARRTRDAASE